MGEYIWSSQYESFIKTCPKCNIIFKGTRSQEESERYFSKYFAQDRATTDGFYGRCRDCVSRHQRASRYGRDCDPDQLLEDQGNACGICRKEIDFERRGSKVLAYIDHDHATGRVRGVLCVSCNTSLGFVENPEWLAKALAYLERTKCE
jgi:hypothetical protein